MTEPTVVEFTGVSFSYGGAPVLEEVSFAVRQGEFVGVVGPNGGGKTTLLRLASGILRPARGAVCIFGGPPERARARVGHVPQYLRFDSLFPVRVWDVVLMGRQGGNGRGLFYRRADKEAAARALREVNLYEQRRRPFAELSGGQRQRVLIARALVSGPELLLLDEPTSQVDVAAEGEIRTLLHGLKGRMTVLWVTHDLSFVSTYVERVLCVNRRLVEHPVGDSAAGAPAEFYGELVRAVRHDRVCATASKRNRAEGRGQ